MGFSSSDEDGDEEWRAAVSSVAVDSTTILTNGFHQVGTGRSRMDDDEVEDKGKSSKLKLCQARAQDLLHRYLDKTLTTTEGSKSSLHVCDGVTVNEDDDIRLFKRAPVGITIEPLVKRLPELIPRKKPRIHPRQRIDEKSAEFQSQLQSVAVDGAVIIAKAEGENAKSLARMQAKDAAAHAAAKREEERVAFLRQQRGEKWLPSIAREMFGNPDPKNNNMQKQCQNSGKKHLKKVNVNINEVHSNGKHWESLRTK